MTMTESASYGVENTVVDPRDRPMPLAPRAHTIFQNKAKTRVTNNVNPGADPGFDQGGAQIVTGLNCWRAQQCHASEMSPFQHGV